MILVLSVLVVLLTSFFCSLSEAALLSLGRARTEVIAEHSAAGRIVRGMKRALNRPIAAILIVNTVANTGGAAVAGAEYREMFGDYTLILFSAALTVAVLVFSEIIPKSLGVRHAEGSALLVAYPLRALIFVMRPFTWVVERMQVLVGMGGSGSDHVSSDDLRAMARLAASSKVLGREELIIIEAAAHLPKVPIRNIMIDRSDVVYLSLRDDAETNLVRARRSLHSRLPVCRSDLDEVVGLVHMKQVLWRLADTPQDLEEEGLPRILGEEMRPPIFASADDDVSDLIVLFSTRREHVALVRDDQERVVGLVTLEDVIEELMGEIDDEFDPTPGNIDRRTDGSWRFGGGVAWADVERVLGLPHTEHLDVDLDGRLDVNDVAAERTPTRQARTGSTFLIQHWLFRVARVRRGKVLLVKAKRLGESAGEEG
jgi:putative hemolysin